MSPTRAFLIYAALGSLASAAPVGVNDVYQEHGGILVMEAERTPSFLGTGTDRWETYTPGEANYVDGAAGEAHLEFQGNSSNGDTPKTPLTYKFKINESGYYHLHLRARQRLDGAASDKNNDCWVKVAGVNGATFGAGPEAGGSHMDDAPLSLLTSYTKMYVSSPVTWGWANLLDAGGSSNKRWPVYRFNAGSTYILTIAGRSINFNYDRILFRKSTIIDTSAKSAAVPESPLNTAASTVPAATRIMLVNADTDRDITPITDGATINLATTGPNLNLRVDTSPPVLGSVRFNLDGDAAYKIDSRAPYTIGGDNIWDDYLPWTPAPGNHSLTVTPYSAAAGGGTAGSPVTVNFTVTDQIPAGSPTVHAGTDKSVVLPASSVALAGSASDAGGSIASYRWDQVAGPAVATITGRNSVSPTVADLTHGIYRFRLTVTDNGGLTAFDDVAVTVSAGPGSPVVNAGVDKVVTLPATSVTLNGTGTDPSNQIYAYLWTQLSGPGNATRAGESTLNLTASNLIQGTYVFRLRVYSETGLVGADDATVTVSSGGSVPAAPVADAGADKAITLPVSSVVINGSSSDSDGTITVHAWTQVSGPAAAVLSGADTSALTASGLGEGTYVFRYTVTDNSGSSASDQVSVSVLPASGGDAFISGELKKWHKVTLSFAGPNTSESATPNPFTDYRLNVTFTHPGSGKTYVVPGYYAADGDAANTSASAGNVWRVHFSPDETGAWTYAASFRTGTNVATNAAATAGSPAGFFDGDSGSFSIAATDKAGTDLRGKGRLQYVGKHHLRFAETGEYFMKAGVDAPENLLAYADFDGDFKTDGQGDSLVKSWSPHAGDWQAGDPTWGSGKGKGLIGAINYLASEGLNAFSFLTMNINGDDKNVFPYTTYSERSRLDVSKLDQWETVFEHGTRKGMYLHFKTQEIENQNLLDGGALGNQRKLYYRELIARFGHHLALNWNLGEECTADLDDKQAWAQYFHDSDPYHHHLVIHNGSNHYNMLGSASKLTGFSLQLNASDFTDMFAMTKDYLDRSEDADRPWVVACDEPGDSRLSLRPDNDAGTSHTDARKNALWGNIMAGGAGCEFYFGYDKPNSDLTCNDFRSRDSFWDYCRHALQFLEAENVPFEQMKNQNSLVSGYGDNANRCLAKTGSTYLVQLHGGGSASLNLSAASGTFTVKWFNPRTGAVASGPTLNGGGTANLGSPPDTGTQDWIALVRSTGGSGGTNTAPVVSAGADKSAFLGGSTVQVSFTGTVTDDGLPAGLALTRNWSVVSGPAPVSLSNANTSTTTATFSTTGSYVLRFSASDTELSSSDDVTVLIQAPSGSQETYAALHDAYTENGSNNNIAQLRVEKSSTRTRISYLQFELGGADGLSSYAATPGTAFVRLTEGDDVSSGTMTLRLYAAASNDWTETGITGATAPAKGPQVAVFTGDVTDGKVIEFDVGTHITGPGRYSFILEADTSTRDVSFAAQENAVVAARPALVVSTGTNAPPAFAGYAETVPVNSEILIPYSLILAGASDPDGDPVSLVVAPDSSEAGGWVAMGTDSLSYRPPIDYSGSDSFLLTVQDGRGGFTSALLTLTITPGDGITGAPPPTLVKSATGGMQIRFGGVAGATYRFQRSTNLVDWFTIHTERAEGEGIVEYEDLDPPAGSAFYRLVSP